MKNFFNINLLTRIYYKAFFYISFLFLLPFLLILLTPFKNKIKFVKIRRDVIGNSIEQLYLYLNIYKKNKYHYFFFDDYFICNEYFNEICKKNLKFSLFGKTIFYLSQHIKIFNKFILNMPTWRTLYKTQTNIKNFKVPKEFKFSNIQNDVGKNFLTSLGVKKNQKIICLMIRDGNYKKKYSNNSKKNWNYHNYRNADLDTYLKTIKYLNKKGYFVIRMGKDAEKSLTYKHPMYFDYARSKVRSDFLDFWIISKCYFSIATGTGIDELCSIYQCPVVDTNMLSYLGIRSFRTNNITIFKKIKYRNNSKYLSLTESIKNLLFSDVHLLETKFLKDFIYQNNSDNEILNAVKEMEKLLSKTYKAKPISIKQKKFWKIYESSFRYKRLYGENAYNYSKICYNNKYLYNNTPLSEKFIIDNKWLLK